MKKSKNLASTFGMVALVFVIIGLTSDDNKTIWFLVAAAFAAVALSATPFGAKGDHTR